VEKLCNITTNGSIYNLLLSDPFVEAPLALESSLICSLFEEFLRELPPLPPLVFFASLLPLAELEPPLLLPFFDDLLPLLEPDPLPFPLLEPDPLPFPLLEPDPLPLLEPDPLPFPLLEPDPFPPFDEAPVPPELAEAPLSAEKSDTPVPCLELLTLTTLCVTAAETIGEYLRTPGCIWSCGLK
jgi:hypothetical protein